MCKTTGYVIPKLLNKKFKIILKTCAYIQKYADECLCSDRTVPSAY